MTTLKDIANETGFSLSTVSYVLNGKKKVKPETYARIMEAVEKLDYHPNQLARSLKMKRSCSIGVIVPDISNAFFPEILKGIDQVAHQNGYNIFLCNTNNDSSLERESINMLISKDIDGLIFIGNANSQILQYSDIPFPVVLVDRKFGSTYTSITANNYRGGYLAAEHLIQSGYRNIALLCGSLTIPNFFERIHGYMDALNQYGIPYMEDHVIFCDCSSSGGYDAVKELIRRDLDVEATFAANDMIALGAMRGFRDNGLLVPDDIALIGFDDIAFAAQAVPSLSTISQPKFDMGKIAAEKLLAQIFDKEKSVEHVVLEPTLVVRETTAIKPNCSP